MKGKGLLRRGTALLLAFLLCFSGIITPLPQVEAATKVDYYEEENNNIASVSITNVKLSDDGRTLSFDYRKISNGSFGKDIEVRLLMDEALMAQVERAESMYWYEWGAGKDYRSDNPGWGSKINDGYSRISRVTKDGDLAFGYINYVSSGNAPYTDHEVDINVGDNKARGLFINNTEDQAVPMRIKFKTDIREILKHGEHYLKTYTVWKNDSGLDYLHRNSRCQIPLDFTLIGYMNNGHDSPLEGHSTSYYMATDATSTLRSRYDAEYNAVVLDLEYKPGNLDSQSNRGVLLMNPALLPFIDHIEVWRIGLNWNNIFDPQFEDGGGGVSIFSTDPSARTMAKDASNIAGADKLKTPSTDPSLILTPPHVEEVNGQEKGVMFIAPHPSKFYLNTMYNTSSWNIQPGKIVVYLKENLANLIPDDQVESLLLFEHMFTERGSLDTVANDKYIDRSFCTSVLPVRDTDKDGLIDDFEQYIGSDASNPDTDGDGRMDGEEVQSAVTQLKSGEYKYLGTDPLTPPPSWPNEAITPDRKTFTGKTTPLRTVALWCYPKDGGDPYPVAECAADENGNYQLDVGLIFSRGGDNSIVGKPNPATANAKRHATPNRFHEGDTIILQAWTDGWDSRKLMFSEPEVPVPVVVSESSPAEPINLYNTEDAIQGRLPQGTSSLTAKLGGVDVPAENIKIDQEKGTFQIVLDEALKAKLPKDDDGRIKAGTELELTTVQYDQKPAVSTHPIQNGPRFENLKPGNGPITVVPPADFDKDDVVLVQINDNLKLPAIYDEGSKKFVVNDLKGQTIADGDTVKIFAVHNGTPLDVVSEEVASGPTAAPTEVRIKKDGDGYVMTGKAEPNAKVQLKDKDGKAIGEPVTASSDGSFTIAVPETYAKDGTELKVSATKKPKTESPDVSATVDAVAPKAPVIGELEEGMKYVPVQIPDDDAVEIEVKTPGGKSISVFKKNNEWQLANGTPVAKTEDGKSLKVPCAALPSEGVVTAIAKDATGNAASADRSIGSPKMNELYEPTAQDVTVDKGAQYTADQFIKNKNDLPAETTYEFVGNPPATSEKGSFPVTVKVKYPDNSEETVSANLIVQEAADKYAPIGQNLTTDKNGELNPADAITNKDALPSDAQYSFKETPDLSTKGDKSAIVVVTYADGSKDEVPITIHVNSDAETMVPTAEDVAVKRGGSVNPDQFITNLKSLPENTTVKYKNDETPSTKTPGTYPVTLVVTYPDGSSEEVSSHLIVNEDKVTYNPIGTNFTVDKNKTPNAEDAISNKGDMPDGTTYAFKNGVPKTNEKGTYPVTVVVSYPDGSSEEVNVNMTVRSDADMNTPATQEVSVKRNGAVTAGQFIANQSELPKGTTYEFENGAPSTEASGSFEVPIVVKYPDGSSETVTGSLVVKPDNESYEPVAAPKTIDKNQTPKAEDLIANKGELPEGTKYELKKPLPDLSKPGEKEVTVVVTYPDGTSDTVKVPVTVRTDAEMKNPVGDTVSVKRNAPITADEFIANKGDMPEGTTYAFDKNVTPSTADSGEQAVKIVVKYPDGSSETVDATLVVKQDKDSYQPETTNLTTDKGQEPNAADAITNKDKLPDGTTYAFETKPDVKTPGDKNVNVVVTYPDGTKDTVPVVVTVRTDAEMKNPVGTTVTAKIGDRVTADQFIENKGDMPKDTVYEFKDNKTPSTAAAGNQDVTIVVKYPDGSSETVGATLTVKPQNESYEPQGQDITVDKNSTPKAEDAVKNKKDLPDGTSYKFEPEPDTKTPGNKSVNVVVTYPDGTSDTIPVTVTVRTDAQMKNPIGRDKTVARNTAVTAEDFVANASDMPQGTTYAFVGDAPSAETAGTKPVKVRVSFPDGSHTDVGANLIVLADNAAYTPQGQNLTTDKNAAPKAEDAITNKDELPKGTTYAFETEPDVTTPGDKPVNVIVTYPDKTTDIVPVTVTVRTDAQMQNPTGQNVTKKQGEPVTAEEFVANKDELKNVKDYTFKGEAPTTDKAGTKQVIVLVNYNDNSSKEVTANLIVQEDNVAYTPIGQDLTVDKSEKPKAEDAISNKKDLPGGTTYAFETEPDVTTPGSKSVNVIVTYPDGTKDTVPVNVTVRTDAETLNPVGQNVTKKIGEAVDPKSFIENYEELKDKIADVTFQGAAPDTKTSGTKPVTLVVKYKDGSSETVDANLIVQTNVESYQPIGKNLTTDKGAVPPAKDAIANLNDLPDGTTVTYKGGDPDVSTAGTNTVTVVVHYPDNTSEEVDVSLTVKTDAQTNDPVGRGVTVKRHEAPIADSFIANRDTLTRVRGCSFPNGAPDTANPGTQTVTVRVTYEDYTYTDIEAPLKVLKDSEAYKPIGKNITVDKSAEGNVPDAKTAIANFADLPGDASYSFDPALDVTTPGEKKVDVVVTYSDGSSDRVPVVVTVRTDADMLNPTGQDVTAKINDAVDPKSFIENYEELKDKIADVTYKGAAPDTSTSGTKPVTLVVKYKDGSSETVGASLIVQKNNESYEPIGKDLTIDKEQTLEPQDLISNASDMPAGTKYSFPDGDPDVTTPGTREVQVKVTYPDGTYDTVSVNLTVRTDSEMQEPTGQNVTKKIGEPVIAKDFVANYDELKNVKNVEFKSAAPSTDKAGTTEVEIVVNYGDGSSDSFKASLTVLTDKEAYDPVGQTVTTDKGITPPASDLIKNKDKLPSTATYEYVEKPNVDEKGEKSVEIKVTYPDGTSETVPATLKVRSDAEMSKPIAGTVTVDRKALVTAGQFITNENALPNGTTFEFAENAAPDTSTAGEKSVTIVVKYPDGTSEEVPATLVVKSDNETYAPIGQEIVVDKNAKPDPKSAISNSGDLPGTAKYAFEGGAPDTTTPGTKEAVVVVTYEDGTTDRVPVTVRVRNDAEMKDPKAQGVTVKRNEKPEASAFIANKADMPADTTYTFKTTVDTSKSGSQTVTIVVHYKDGSSETVDAPLTVLADNEGYTPIAKTISVDKNGDPNPEDAISNKDQLPKGTTYSFETKPDVSKPGAVETTVIVTYPDGTKDEVPVTINVRGDGEIQNPVGQTVRVKQGDSPEAADFIANASDMPQGTTYTFKDGAPKTDKAGTYEVAIIAHFTDGTTKEVPAKILVQDDNVSYEPIGQPIVVDKNQPADPEQGVGNAADMPKGTKFAFETEPDTSKSGTQEVKIVVTYPDKTQDTVTVSLTVNKDLAEKTNPEPQNVQAKQGEAVKPEQFIKDADKLPPDTTVTFQGTAPKTDKAGEQDVVVVVTYSDGSSETVSSKLTVLDDNAAYEPIGKDLTTRKGVDPNPQDAIKNAKDMPKGTSYAFESKPDVSKAGDVTAKVIVTYPDKTTDEVTVKITVKEDQNVLFDPIGQNITTEKGVMPDPKGAIENIADLPDGTTVAFEPEPDIYTPGTREVTVVVTYPDGTKDEVSVKITVDEPGTKRMKDAYQPIPQDVSVAIDDQPHASTFISNLSELPAGTKYTYKNGAPDTSKAGNVPVTVVVRYPDGTSEEVSATLTVNPNNVTYEPVAKDVAVEKGTPINAADTIANKDALPEGTTYAFETAPDVNTPGHKEAKVIVTYPDGTKDEVTVKIDVTNPAGTDPSLPKAPVVQPIAAGDTVVKVRRPTDDTKKITVTVPGDPGQTVEIVFDPATTTWKDTNGTEINEDANGNLLIPTNPIPAGEGTVKVTAELEGGAKNTTEVPVAEKEAMKDLFDPRPKRIVVKYGETADPAKGIVNPEQLPAQTTYSFESAPDTTIPGDQAVTVLVKYPDGTVDSVPVTLVVLADDNQKYSPIGKELTVEEGKVPNPADAISNPEDLPKDIDVSFKEPVDTSKPGTQKVTIVVTYPDGTKDELEVTLNVEKKPTEAEKHPIVGQPITVKEGETPNPADGIKNKADLPDDVTIAFEKPIDTSKPGTQKAVIVVTYNDGSSNTVEVDLTVTEKTQAELYDPIAKKIDVEEGKTPNPADGIANKDKLPQGTKFEFEKPVDTKTPGTRPAVIVVTYPDGTSETITVPVTVTEAPKKDSEKYEPIAKPINVPEGQKPNPADAIANKDKLPKGTRFEFEGDVDNLPVGTHDLTVVVTYPDGSSEKTVVRVTVGTPAPVPVELIIRDKNGKVVGRLIGDDSSIDPGWSVRLTPISKDGYTAPGTKTDAYRIELIDANGKPVEPKNGKEVTVILNVPGSMKPASPSTMSLFFDGGTMRKLPYGGVGGGYDQISFKLSKSGKLIFRRLTASKPGVPSKPGSRAPKTGDAFLLTPTVMLLAAGAYTALATKKRKK